MPVQGVWAPCLHEAQPVLSALDPVRGWVGKSCEVRSAARTQAWGQHVSGIPGAPCLPSATTSTRAHRPPIRSSARQLACLAGPPLQ